MMADCSNTQIGPQQTMKPQPGTINNMNNATYTMIMNEYMYMIFPKTAVTYDSLSQNLLIQTLSIIKSPGDNN